MNIFRITWLFSLMLAATQAHAQQAGRPWDREIIVGEDLGCQFADKLETSRGSQGILSSNSAGESLQLQKSSSALLTKLRRIDTSEMIYNPEGERRNYDMSRVYVVDWQGYTATDYGYLQTVSFASDGAVYFNRLMPRITFNDSWIKGQLENDSNGQLYVKITSPQLTFEREDGLKFYMMAVVKDAQSGELTAVDSFRFKLSGDSTRMEATDDSIWLIGIDDNGDIWEQDRGHTLVQFDDTIPQVPAGADVKTYTFKYYEPAKPKEPLTKISSVAFEETDAYLKGLCPLFPDRWVKGHVSGNVIAVPSGEYIGQNGNYITRIFAAMNEDGGLRPVDTLYLTFNADTTIIKSTRNDYTLFGYSIYAPEYTSYYPSYTKFNIAPAVPKAPCILGYSDNFITFTLSPVDVNGATIDPAHLCYRVLINGDSYIFTKENYPSLDSDCPCIPYGYTDFVNFDIYNDAFSTKLYPQETVNRLAMQSVYVIDGVENTSELVTLETDADIDIIKANPAVISVEYYDISGQRISEPVKGFVISRTRFADGHVINEKILR